jgi:aminopeptidase YwaD
MQKIILILLITLSTVQANILKDTVNYLSSNELEGRRAGTPGNILATNFLEQKIKKLGLAPLGTSYKQEFTIFTKMQKSGKNIFELTSNATSNSFQPISYSLSGDLTNTDLVFAGFGITVPKSDSKLKYDDYELIDVKGKIVVLLTGDPGIGNMSSRFRDPSYINFRSIFYKLKNAIIHGAKGVLIVQDPLSITDLRNEPAPLFNSTEGGGKRFASLAGYITNKDFNSLVSKKNSTLKLQKLIAKNQRPNSFKLSQSFNMSVHLKKITGRVSNVVAVKKGSHPTLSKEVIVIGAHFDHLGFGGESSMDPRNVRAIHNGADDNASGSGLVMAMANKISKMDTQRTFVFSFFNAEEVGLLGSAHFVSMWPRHLEEYGELKAMLNYDMIGRYQANKEVVVMGTDSAHEWSNYLTALKNPLTIKLKKSAVGSSDHASFTAKKIPALFFSTGAHADYHRSSDDSDKIDYISMNKIISHSMQLVSTLASASSITYNTDYDDGSSSGGSRGYGAHLGCVPQFAQSDDIVGVVCTRASANSPAQSAGIIANDVLIQIGDIEIKSIYDLAFALKYYRAGDTVELAWMRASTPMRATVLLVKKGSEKHQNHHFPTY